MGSMVRSYWQAFPCARTATPLLWPDLLRLVRVHVHQSCFVRPFSPNLFAYEGPHFYLLVQVPLLVLQAPYQPTSSLLKGRLGALSWIDQEGQEGHVMTANHHYDFA